MDNAVRVISSTGREGWSVLPAPGPAGVAAAELAALASADGRFSTGLWEGGPDSWSFERPYHEVALIVAGEADIETPGGDVHTVRAGDVLVTPKGSKGTWHIREKIVKFYAIYDAGEE